MGSLDWMADVLRRAGLVVVEYPGWRDRRAPGAFNPKALIWHHDASRPGPSPAMDDLIAVHGNGTTPAPLSQCWVDTEGVWHLTASGRANHAGIGAGWGVIRKDRGNEDAIGIETDHTIGEAWPAAQITSLRRGSRALLDHMGAKPSNALAGHKEYAPGRKSDPDGLDMAWERANLPAAQPAPAPTPEAREDDVMRFVHGDAARPWSDFVFKVVWTSGPSEPIAVRVHVPIDTDPGYRIALATGAGMDPKTGKPYSVKQSDLDRLPFASKADQDRFETAMRAHVAAYDKTRK